MKHGDLEFQQRTGPLIDLIWEEGRRTARENQWSGLVIELTAANPVPGAAAGLRCSLRSTGAAPEVDEPSVRLLKAARELQELFGMAGSSFTGVTMELIPDQQGRFSRQCRFRYD